MMPPCDLHTAGREQGSRRKQMSDKRTKPDKPGDVQRTPPPPQKRRRESAPHSDKRKKFSDVPYVQQPLFDLDQGGAR
jgi:hypothetical protein